VAKEKLTKVNGQIHPQKLEELLEALSGYVDNAEAHAQASEEMADTHTHHRLSRLEEEDQVNRQLAEMKSKRGATAPEA